MAIQLFGDKNELAVPVNNLPPTMQLQMDAAERDTRADVLVPSILSFPQSSILLTEDNPAVRVPAEVARSGKMIVHGDKKSGVDAYLYEDVVMNTTFALPSRIVTKGESKLSVDYRGADTPKHLKFEASHSRRGQDPLPYVVTADLPDFLATTRRFVLASQNADLVIEFPHSHRLVSMQVKYGRNVFLVTVIGEELEIRREPIFTTDLLKAFKMEVSVVTQDIPVVAR